jgi:asparagine synthase (glutamine-hydrolysing)
VHSTIAPKAVASTGLRSAISITIPDTPRSARTVSGICGYVGPGSPETLQAMLAAIDYRGDRTETAVANGVGLGYRWWGGRPGKSPGIHRAGDDLLACAGTLAPPAPSPAASLLAALRERRFDSLDGAFAAARWDGAKLTLIRDPFGVRSLYVVSAGETFYFASELKQLLAVPGIEVALDPAALHKYLTFSFVPGADVPIRGVKRLLPGHVGVFDGGRFEASPYFTLQESADPELAAREAAVRRVRELCREAVAKRLHGETDVGVFLSGGIDSSGVAAWLREAGVRVHAFSLDFGERSVERDEAAQVAAALELRHEFLPVKGEDLEPVFWDLVWKLDLPFGDAVTGPQYLLGRAARAAGLAAVFNGEGGDQLFGGWTSKPMVAAAVYGDFFAAGESLEETYLRSYHRFYRLEDELYTPEFRAQVGPPGQRRAHLAPYLGEGAAETFLHRVRLADIALKGSQNILPRAERMANAWALDVRVPLFDRALATAAFALPPQLKLRGATEKFVLKLALKDKLPEAIVWRRKYGMGAPSTDWLLGPLAPLAERLLGRDSLEARGLFRDEFVAALRQGRDAPGETRRRRVGERLWALLMLEAWLRVFVDGRGRRPEGAP